MAKKSITCQPATRGNRWCFVMARAICQCSRWHESQGVKGVPSKPSPNPWECWFLPRELQTSLEWSWKVGRGDHSNQNCGTAKQMASVPKANMLHCGSLLQLLSCRLCIPSRAYIGMDWSGQSWEDTFWLALCLVLSSVGWRCHFGRGGGVWAWVGWIFPSSPDLVGLNLLGCFGTLHSWF